MSAGPSRRYLLFPAGSAGDVHPFVALALGLRRRGHDVAVFGNGHFADLFVRHGVAFTEISPAERYLEIIAETDLWKPGLASLRLVARLAAEQAPAVYDVVRAHRDEPGVAFVSGALALGARVAEERFGIEHATVQLAPAGIPSLVRPPRVRGVWLRPWMPMWLRRASYRLAERAGAMLLGELHAFRASVGVRAPRRPGFGWLNSPRLTLLLCPEWFAPPAPDWPPSVRLAGFPLYDEADLRPPDPEAEAFLEDARDRGGAVVATPGSAMRQGADFFAAAVDACRRLGRPGLLLTPHAAQVPAPLPPEVRRFDYLPLSRALGGAAALVHHGGIGTLAQGLAAGVPQIACAMAFDQHDNAERLERLGAGRLLERRRLDGPRLARVLRDLLADRTVLVACRAAAARLATEDGVARACEWLERGS